VAGPPLGSGSLRLRILELDRDYLVGQDGECHGAVRVTFRQCLDGGLIEPDLGRARLEVIEAFRQESQHPATAVAGKLLRDGRVGPMTLIKTGRYFVGTRKRAPWRWYGYYTHWDRPDPKEVLRDLDWEAWLGPAPKIDFNERHFWHWRCYWAYGTGQAGDLLSHEMDHVQCVLGWGIPETCLCAGQLTYYKDDREIPDVWIATYGFEQRDCTVTFEGCMNSNRQQTPEYVGKSGRLVFDGIGQDANNYRIFDDRPAFPFQGGITEPAEVYDAAKAPQWPTHMQDFLRCVRTGERPKCHMDEAFIEVVTYLMSVASYKEKRQVRRDPKARKSCRRSHGKEAYVGHLRPSIGA